MFFEGVRSSFVLNPLGEVWTTARSQPGPAGMPVQAGALHSGWRFCLHLQGRSRPHTKASLPESSQFWGEKLTRGKEPSLSDSRMRVFAANLGDPEVTRTRSCPAILSGLEVCSAKIRHLSENHDKSSQGHRTAPGSSRTENPTEFAA